MAFVLEIEAMKHLEDKTQRSLTKSHSMPKSEIKPKNMETDRQTDRQTEWQTDRQTEKSKQSSLAKRKLWNVDAGLGIDSLEVEFRSTLEKEEEEEEE